MSGGFALGLAAAAIVSWRPAQLLIAGGSFMLMAGGFTTLEIGTISLLGDPVSESHETTF